MMLSVYSPYFPTFIVYPSWTFPHNEGEWWPRLSTKIFRARYSIEHE